MTATYDDVDASNDRSPGRRVGRAFHETLRVAQPGGPIVSFVVAGSTS